MQDVNNLPTPQELLETRGQDYGPRAYYSGYLMTRARPIFGRWVIQEMLTDPKIAFGLWLIKGPILSQAKFSVECQDAEVKEYLITQINRFWRTSAIRALKAIEWGFSGSEILYYQNPEDGRLHFDRLRDFQSTDVNPVVYHGEISGITVNNVIIEQQRHKIYLGGMKKLYHLHWRDRNPFIGVARLFGCYVPWWEKWSDGGFRDVRRLWFYKNAYEGGTIYHPPGSTRLETGEMVPNKFLARELVDKKRTGGTLTLPNTPAGDTGGNKAWEYVPPQANPVPEGLLEYGDNIDREILEGIGIPPEVIESSGDTGFGSSTGRQVPQTAFYSTLQELVQWLITDFDEQCLRGLVKLGWPGQNIQYEIVPFELGAVDNSADGMDGEGGNQYVDEDGDGRDEKLEGEDTDGDKMDALLRKSGKEKGKKSSIMSHAPLLMRQATEGTWITIGGRAQGGQKHVGGFPVRIDSEGRITAGGPKSLRGVRISDAGEHLSRLNEPDIDESREGNDHARQGLPHPNSAVGQAIRNAVGEDDPDMARGFYELLQETHAQHRAEVAERRSRTVGPEKKRTYAKVDPGAIKTKLEQKGIHSPELEQFLTEAASSGKFKDQRDLLLTIDRQAASLGKKGTKDLSTLSKEERKAEAAKPLSQKHVEHFKNVLDKREKRNQAYPNWKEVLRDVGQKYRVSPEDFSQAADEVLDLDYGNAKRLNQIRRSLLSRLGLNASTVHEKLDTDQIRGFDDFARRVAGDYPELGLGYGANQEAGENVDASDKLLEFLKEEETSLPKKTDQDFVNRVLTHMGVTSGVEELPMHHPDIIDATYTAWKQRADSAKDEDLDFDPMKLEEAF